MNKKIIVYSLIPILLTQPLSCIEFTKKTPTKWQAIREVLVTPFRFTKGESDGIFLEILPNKDLKYSKKVYSETSSNGESQYIKQEYLLSTTIIKPLKQFIKNPDNPCNEREIFEHWKTFFHAIFRKVVVGMSMIKSLEKLEYAYQLMLEHDRICEENNWLERRFFEKVEHYYESHTEQIGHNVYRTTHSISNDNVPKLVEHNDGNKTLCIIMPVLITSIVAIAIVIEQIKR